MRCLCAWMGDHESLQLLSAAFSATSISGNANRNPAACNFTGCTRALASSASSAICPNIMRTANAGTARNAGRRSCRPKARVNSALVTGFGAVTLSGPDMPGDSRANRVAATTSRQCDPAHPLSSAAETRAQTEAKRRQHLLQRAMSRPQHDAESEMNDADSRLRRRCCRRFPLPAEIGEKARSRRRRFLQHLIAAVAVDSNRRCHQKSLWRLVQRGQQSGQPVRGVDPADGQFAPVRVGPAMRRHACPGEVNRCRRTFQPCSGILDRTVGARIPLQLSFGGRHPS